MSEAALYYIKIHVLYICFNKYNYIIIIYNNYLGLKTWSRSGHAYEKININNNKIRNIIIKYIMITCVITYGT